MAHRLLLLSALVAALAVTALAHHGWTGYDEKNTLNLTGTIRESSYDNPHASIQLQVQGANGKTWTAVLAPPFRMQSRGLEKDSIKPGTAATVIGYPSKSNPNELRVERIIIGGKTTELR